MKKILFAVVFLGSSFAYTMDQNGKSEDEQDSKVYRERLEPLGKLTAYKRDMYLERLVGTGAVSLDQIRAIHKEIEEGLDYSPNRMDKESGKWEARWECAMRLAPEGIKEFVKARRRSGDRFNCCHMILLYGRCGVGKETLAKGIAHALGLKQMVVPAHQLLDETELGTELRVRDVVVDFSSRSNTALILDNVDCLLARQNKYANPDHILSALRLISRSSGKKLLICTGEQPRQYPECFFSELSVAARIDAPDADQRSEIVKVMFADKKAVFEPEAEKYLEENLRKVEGASCRNLQGLVNCIDIDAGLAHTIGDRENGNVRIEDVRRGLRLMEDRLEQ